MPKTKESALSRLGRTMKKKKESRGSKTKKGAKK